MNIEASDINLLYEHKIKLNTQQIKKYLQIEQMYKQNKTNYEQQNIINNSLALKLQYIAKENNTTDKIKIHQKKINNFLILINQLHKHNNNNTKKSNQIFHSLSSYEINEQLITLNNQVTNIIKQFQQKKNQLSFMKGESLIEQSYKTRNYLYKITKYVWFAPVLSTKQEKVIKIQDKQYHKNFKVTKLELSHIHIIIQQTLSKLDVLFNKKQRDETYKTLQILCHQTNDPYKKETKKTIEYTNKLTEQKKSLPKTINHQLKVNNELSLTLNQQSQYINYIALQQQKTKWHILQVNKKLATLIEQAKWLNKSPVLGETLRSQLSNLPNITKPQKLDHDMDKLRIKRLQYEKQINQIPLISTQCKQDNGQPLLSEQRSILDETLNIQRNLLNLLIASCDNQIIELTKLKINNSKLEEIIHNIQKATHRYLFWVADIRPITLSYPLYIYQDLSRLLTINTLNQLTYALQMIFTSQETLLPMIGSLILIAIAISFKKSYHNFLERSSQRVGKVHQDSFLLTLNNICLSLLMAIPIPILWTYIGYGLNHAWPYPIAVAIGYGVKATIPILWVFMTSNYFAKAKGLFIIHLGWPKQQVNLVMRHYTLSISMIVPLAMALVTFNNYNDQEFVDTLGRLCFILLCLFLAIITNSLKRSGLPLYLNKHGSGINLINKLLWNMIICAPIMAAISACLGYLATAQALLIRLETSVFIWIILLIIYHIIRRWMFIQRRRIAFERSKQRRSEILANRARINNNNKNLYKIQQNKITEDIDKKILDLDTISNKSLQLIRSILTLIALISVIFIWSELHSAFGFLENITLWDVTSHIKGVDNIQPITLAAVIIAILVVIITTKIVRNLPSLLELTILQHLDLTPGTGYAITSLTKYSIMLLGFLIGFSLIGIEWSKLQWLIAALGVGLGFGLQEIFANFISGLIILFEKPIRIGDTITIRNLTGNVTNINTRATTITDWDHKEIIVPNKDFITKQFINWSLSDTITRVVLKIPAPVGSNIEEITNILTQAAYCCPLVLSTPAPETYLIDLQQGVPLFEMRLYAAKMSHRMPLRHQMHTLIINNYRKHGLELPFPPIQIRKDQINITGTNQNSNSSNDIL